MAIALPRDSDRPHPQGLYEAIRRELPILPRELAALIFQYAKYTNTFYGPPLVRNFEARLLVTDRVCNVLRGEGGPDYQLVAMERAPDQDENDQCGNLTIVASRSRMMFSRLKLPNTAYPRDPSVIYQGNAQEGTFTVSAEMISYEMRMIAMETPVFDATADPAQRLLITSHHAPDGTNHCRIWDHATLEVRHTIRLERMDDGATLSASTYVFAAFQFSKLSIFDLATGTLLWSMNAPCFPARPIQMAVGDNSVVIRRMNDFWGPTFVRLRFRQVDEAAFLAKG